MTTHFDFAVVDAVTDTVVEYNFECRAHAELFIEVHSKDYPNAELYVESI
jgi:hypothetical protein